MMHDANSINDDANKPGIAEDEDDSEVDCKCHFFIHINFFINF